MLYYERIDVSEGIDVNKKTESKECNVCHYRYFSNKGFMFQPNVWNRCHDLSMMFIKLTDIAILKGFGCRCIISRISKNEATSLMQNADLIIIHK